MAIAARWIGGLCALSMLIPAVASGAVKRMFVTSSSGSGRLATWPEAMGQTGASAGNQICRTLAVAAGLPNGAAYRAWLSTSATDAYCRVAGHAGKRDANCGLATLPDAGPWERTDGRPFAESLRTLTDEGRLYHPPLFDEAGHLVEPSELWTGTSPDGRVSPGFDCGLWTGLSGDAVVGLSTTGGTDWTSQQNHHGCDEDGRLLCFDPGIGEPLPDFELPGAYVFVTSAMGDGWINGWPEADGSTFGVAAADSICRYSAEAAGLQGSWTYVAWLSEFGTDALDHLPAGIPFKRLDGVRVASNKVDLTTFYGEQFALLAPIVVTETGEYKSTYVYTGTDIDGQLTPVTFCEESFSNGMANATAGNSQEVRAAWTDIPGVLPCSWDASLYCFSSVVTIFRDGFELGLAHWSNF